MKKSIFLGKRDLKFGFDDFNLPALLRKALQVDSIIDIVKFVDDIAALLLEFIKATP